MSETETTETTETQTQTETETTETSTETAQSAETQQTTETSTETVRDWYADWAGEDEALKTALSRYEGPQAAAKALVESKAALRESGRVKIPGEDASDDDKAQFREQMGIPDAADGYEIAVNPPEGLEISEPDQAMLTQITKQLHDSGGLAATPGVVNMAHQLYYDVMVEREAQLEAAADSQHEIGRAEIEKEWGDQVEINKQFANAAISTHFGADAEEVLNMQLADGTRLGDHPPFMRGMMNAGRATIEDMTFLRALSGKSDMTAATIDEKIAEIQGLYSAGKMDEYAKRQGELQTLMARRDRVSGQAA